MNALVAPLKPECVILLHGAGRTPRSMNRLARALAKSGFQIHNLGYPSRRASLEELAVLISKQIDRIRLDPNRGVHFVTHSLGGIVLRCYLKDQLLPNLGRVVMLAPPNRGAELADRFAGFRLYHRILGPVSAQIGTAPESQPNALGPVDYEVGVIAGNRSLNPLFSTLIPGPDDGRIGVESTKLDGMKDFLLLPCIHPLIMYYPIVIRQTIYFLRHGRFDHTRAA